MRNILFILAVLGFAQSAFAALKTVPVTDGVFALVGPHEQRSPENLANNAAFGVVVTADGVVLIDPGGSWKGAEQIHHAIRKLTDQPVKVVINSGGQDHRWLGNGYWKTQGARIIASTDAVEDQDNRVSQQLTMLDSLLGGNLAGTEPVHAQETFEESLKFTQGGMDFEIVHPGQAHTPGESFVWLPQKKVVFTGDIVYVERILGVFEFSNSASWVEVFETMASYEPEYIVPGHGNPTTLEHARADTYDYLANLREKIRAHLDAGGDIIDSVNVDQSAFSYLVQFEVLSRRNAQSVYVEMEFE